ncbi:MAG: hypothetical protein AAFU78_22710, partial [Cyanobacteria bacterium J06633_2]
MPNGLTEAFDYWDEYWGLLYSDDDVRFPTQLWGFESFTDSARTLGTVNHGGATFGFLQTGKATIRDSVIEWNLLPEQWFALPDGLDVELQPYTRLMISQRRGFRGISAMGGPIETVGRLRYIDGCSDSLLCAPPIFGAPCLNFLHFPSNIHQTPHTHPSTRAGIVARGSGTCITPTGRTELCAGRIFYIPRNSI